MKLSGWQEVEGHPALPLGHVLDLRPAAAFARGHLPGAACFETLADGRVDLADALPSVLLPPRRAPLLICGDAADRVAEVVAFLRDRGRDAVDGAVLAAADAPPGLLVTGPESAPLWRPAPFLSGVADLLPPPPAGPVLDLGCGGGRDAVWLAQRGYVVTAADRLEDALDLARRLARLHDVAPTFLRRDLEDPALVPPGPWSLVLSVRYLDRDLLRRLPDLLLPGGAVLLRTFRWEDDVPNLPRRRFCVEPGELDVLLPPDRFETLRRIDDRFDDDRPAVGVLARLRPDG